MTSATSVDGLEQQIQALTLRNQELLRRAVDAEQLQALKEEHHLFEEAQLTAHVGSCRRARSSCC